MKKKTITRAKGGTRECKVSVDDIHVPDLWHIAVKIETGEYEKLLLSKKEKKYIAEQILDCWGLSHDLLRHVREEMEALKNE